MAGESLPPLPPIPPSAQSAAPPSLCSTSPTMAKLTPSLEQQIGEELPAAGDVLGDPQLQVGGEPKMSSEIHGKLPKKIRKKKSSDACGELQWASDVRDGNEVPTSLPLSKKSAKKVTIKNSDKSPTAGTKRPLSEASGSSRAKKAAKLINAKVEMTQLQNKSKPVRKVAPIVSRSPMINMMARQRAQSHGSPNFHAMSPTVAATLKLPSLRDLSPTATNGTAAFMHDLSPTATNGTPASMHDPSPTATNGSKRRPRKLTYKIWKDAEPIYVGGLLMQGRCKYCSNVFLASKVSGTSQLGRHLKAIITLFRSPSKHGVCGQSATSKPRACG